ncbi:hypothetical protein JOC83_001771 [Bacillus iocasae]|uniref:Uncharacterized protein n=1 Tax=Priestia iocasae TaxID=2291674 RepID=A0ABS2QTW9_9BACI|nr:hypothetical protein [Metabacillus iocasae]
MAVIVADVVVAIAVGAVAVIVADVVAAIAVAVAEVHDPRLSMKNVGMNRENPLYEWQGFFSIDKT